MSPNRPPQPYKRSLKQRISDNWIFALPVIGATGGAAAGVYYGATVLAMSAVATAGLAVGGAVSGAIGVTAVGLGAYAAGHTIWKNKEYIALGAMFSVALAGKMLSWPFTKSWDLLKKPFSGKSKKKQADAQNAPATAKPAKSKLADAQSGEDFNAAAPAKAPKKEAKNDNAPAQKQKKPKKGNAPDK